VAQGGWHDPPLCGYNVCMDKETMNDKQIIFLREQLQETLCCWRDANDLPDHVDEELCDIVLQCFIEADECDSVETVPA